MTQVETEPVPESGVQPSTDKSAADPPTDDRHMPTAIAASDGLKRLAAWFPKEVSSLTETDHEGLLPDPLCVIYAKLNRTMSNRGFEMIADVAEFIERWKPGNGEKREAIAILATDMAG